MSPFVFLWMMFSLSSFSPSSSSTSISLPLSPLTGGSSIATTKWQELNRLAATSLSRVHRLKQLKTDVNVPLFPTSGAYSVSLSIGTPSQTLSFIMDTGSSLLWVPCTNQYSCTSCVYQGEPRKYRKIFDPQSSSTSTYARCDNKKFRWIEPDIPKEKCKTGHIAGYTILYGLGNTTGKFLFETLTFPELIQYPTFLLGCSLISYHIPYGIAGFGRELDSLPAQMGLDSFSYCMLSHQYNDRSSFSNLVLTKGEKPIVSGIKYMPFVKFPTNTLHPEFSGYYYVPLWNITVGSTRVKGLKRTRSPNSTSGNGGTIVDSGTTITYLEESLFSPVVGEFETQLAVKGYTRNRKAENGTGLDRCFTVPKGRPHLKSDVPRIKLEFEGGTVMNLPLENYFIMVERSVGCLLVFTSIPDPDQGPAVILGNYLQQNYYMEYDLKNNRLGILHTDCNKK